MAKNTKITVFGGGLWGAVLAQHLARAGRQVRLWEFFPEAALRLKRSRRHPHIPGFRLDDSVAVTSDLSEARGSDVLLFVLPSHNVRATAKALRTILAGSKAVVVNASKGIEPASLLTQSEVIASELPWLRSRLYTLSGPSFAREVARGVPTHLLLAGPRAGAAGLLRLFNAGALRTRWCADRKGVELGGSLKNVLAIGCGVLDGLKAGANTKAALIVQGMSEMGELVRRFGGKPETVYGLAGLGDLIATGTSAESRNRAFGEKLGQGLSPAQARRRIATVVEGVEAAESAHALAARAKLKAPLIEAIWAAVHKGRAARGVVKALGFKGF
jgi:glycerol-3-phosphate dehydrogenase (NAD(P)+)